MDTLFRSRRQMLVEPNSLRTNESENRLPINGSRITDGGESAHFSGARSDQVERFATLGSSDKALDETECSIEQSQNGCEPDDEKKGIDVDALSQVIHVRVEPSLHKF
jgi:hypothetical protein